MRTHIIQKQEHIYLLSSKLPIKLCETIGHDNGIHPGFSVTIVGDTDRYIMLSACVCEHDCKNCVSHTYADTHICILSLPHTHSHTSTIRIASFPGSTSQTIGREPGTSWHITDIILRQVDEMARHVGIIVAKRIRLGVHVANLVSVLRFTTTMPPCHLVHLTSIWCQSCAEMYQALFVSFGRWSLETRLRCTHTCTLQ